MIGGEGGGRGVDRRGIKKKKKKRSEKLDRQGSGCFGGVVA